jgi:transposase
MVLVRQRTQLKNRIHATLAKYALHDVEVTDLFGVGGRMLLRQRLDRLPPHTAYASQQLLEQIEALDGQVRGFEQRIQATFKPTPEIQRMLAAGGGAHAGRGDRARGRGRYAVSHGREAGCLCGDHPAGPRERWEGPIRPARPDVNRYLKWAFVEAANAICLTRGRTSPRHVSRLYERVARRKGHAKAIGAVARHLAETTYWVLRNGESYREPKASKPFRPRGISAEAP